MATNYYEFCHLSNRYIQRRSHKLLARCGSGWPQARMLRVNCAAGRLKEAAAFFFWWKSQGTRDDRPEN